MAMDPDSYILTMVAYAWAGFGAAFGPAILFSLFWKRMTRHGCIAGIVVGGLTVLIWKQFGFFWPIRNCARLHLLFYRNLYCEPHG